MINQSNTLTFYNSNANSFIEQTISVDMHQLYQPFIDNLPVRPVHQQHILDLGCGSGRDSMYFAKLGFNVTAIDGSRELIERAKIHHNDMIDWQCVTFEQIPFQNWYKRFTSIWACASLLHVPSKELPELVDNLLTTLTDKGSFYASFKYGNSEYVDNGRFFCDMNEECWETLKQKINHKFKEETWLTIDQRTNRNKAWFNIMIKKV
ncbi:class I SAM-dependent methyltransferase [Psychrobacter sp. APC 3279]|uniref:class I SAM-dependent methyltransferase n=1 Tax=Psychrobacter sp. APC 3279 TaxID=3035189 RepID=UPI0025B53861|nr:class I SAM-dependent methyltransferase [Psychrobacter sp. APC 3279]MDN3440018.1 class I SAM-dependent methyltransferase [Psychrobacter sp. APC 3279]